MNNENKKQIPEMRFPEFIDDGQWGMKKLKNISEVIMGSSPSSLSYNENGIGLPLLQGNAGIKNRLSSPRIYTSEITKECKPEDILLSVRAPVGTVAKSLHKACIGRGISALRTFKENSQEYLYQLLYSKESSWKKVSQGGTFDAVNSDDIKNLLLPIPSPNEQQKIASCLSSLDELITAQKEKLELLKNHKKGLMQNLFPQEGETVPKFRFPEFENDGDWVEKKLGSIGNPSMCKRIFKEETSPNGKNKIPFYKIGTFGKEPDAFISKELYEEYKSKFSFPKKGEILISASGTIGRLVVYDGEPAFFQDSNIVWISNKEEKVLNKFLSYIYSLLTWQTSDGGIIKRLYNADLKNMDITFPENKIEQNKIASCLSSLDSIISSQTDKIEKLQFHKKGLMQGLFPKMID